MKLYKFRSLSALDQVADILVNERLYCAEYRALNDPFEGIFIHHIPDPKCKSLGDVEHLIDYALDSCLPRVCSLSADPLETRLWSLYADSHRGIAIEIDTDRMDDPPQEVAYNESLATLRDPTVNAALRNKTNVWSYESEFRIITDKTFIPITGAITRVLMGSRCVTQKQILEKLCPPGCELMRMTLNYDTGKVSFPR